MTTIKIFIPPITVALQVCYISVEVWQGENYQNPSFLSWLTLQLCNETYFANLHGLVISAILSQDFLFCHRPLWCSFGIQAIALLHRIFNNVENIKEGRSNDEQPEIDSRSKMGEEQESQPSSRKAFVSASHESRSHSASELCSVSNNWQTPLICTTLSLPFLAVVLQLVWEHMGGNSQLAEGPIVPLSLAWYLLLLFLSYLWRL